MTDVGGWMLGDRAKLENFTTWPLRSQRWKVFNSFNSKSLKVGDGYALLSPSGP